MAESERSIRTRGDVAADLARLGVHQGDILLVHSSLSRIGYVPGGPVAVVQALLDAVGPEGTVVVPAQTGDNSDPAGWSRPPVPEDWWQTIRAHTPGFDPRVTPTRGMGAIPEVLRTWPGAVRSAHPQTSFAAVGPRAGEIVAVHDLDSQCGDRSPLGALERLGARVLLLGADFQSCTAFHLAEYRLEGVPAVAHGAAVLTEAGRTWATFEDIQLDEDDFPDIGAAFSETGAVTTGTVGDAASHLFDLRDGVAFAAAWMAKNRGAGGS
jgi:aminoglycoside 3-N-acetyltransferase